MRIEMVVPSMIAAGMETVVANLSRSLVKRGHRVGITCLQSRGVMADALEGEGIRVTVVDASGPGTLLWPAALRNWFRKLSPDVVHAHSGVWMKSARAAHLAGVRTVLHTMHGFPDVDPWHRPWIERLASLWTTAIAVVSEPLRTYVVDTLHVAPARVHLLLNGVDAAKFRPAAAGEAGARFGQGPGRVIIGHIGRFSPVKNHALLLDAFARVHAEHPEAYLVLVGDGPLRDEVRARASSLGIAEHVAFPGIFLDAAPLYRDMDVFVLPSLLEQTSMSILEAMASGVPVIATGVGGSPALLDHGKAGVLVPSGDVNMLADSMCALIRDPNLRRELGLRGRARALAEYDHEKMVDRYESLYGVPSRVAQT
jgi:sugar transferase (PEP-CTERM/EpsH1 system associated)